MANFPKTPGVYINELNAFPNAVVPVATAIPAFVGYTPNAVFDGQPCVNQAVKIDSLQEFMNYFGLRDPFDPAGLTFLAQNLQYQPTYYPVASADPATAAVTLGGKCYDVEPDSGTVYYLYNSVILFYANGGGACYVVSVGLYSDGKPAGLPKPVTASLVNANVRLSALLAGVSAVADKTEPTMIVVPDATLLTAADNQALNQEILAQCDQLKSRVGLFDIPGADRPDPVHWRDAIAAFRTGIGLNHLCYGIAYYPFLKTSVMSAADIDYLNIGGGSKTLAAVLPDANSDPLQSLIAAIDHPAGRTPRQIEAALLQASSDYQNLHDAVLARANILPPGAALAGVYTTVDNNTGVWQAPANVALSAVIDTTLKITDADQQSLKVDAATGKSINAIRLFPGRGVLVWGARTLDGNSEDWRYINVRRTLIFLEQSMRLAVQAYAFAPNVANTWSLVASVLNNFLTTIWSQGGLVGPTPASAFSVAVGLGQTMTSQDILDGFMNISVKVAVTHPAEFVVISLQQQMQIS